MKKILFSLIILLLVSFNYGSVSKEISSNIYLNSNESQKVNVLAIEINPILTTITDKKLYANNSGHPKVSEWFKHDVNKSISELKKDLEEASHGYLKITVKKEYLNEFPTYTKDIKLSNGNTSKRYDEETYIKMSRDGNNNYGNWYNMTLTDDFNQATGFGILDYEYLIDKFDLVNRRNNNEFDQVWLFIASPIGAYETVMVGRSAYWINGKEIIKDCSNFPIAGLEIARRDSQFHSLGHMAENILNFVYNGTYYEPKNQNVNSKDDYKNLNTWDKFTLSSHTNNSNYTSVGDVHFPFNANSDYDYNNKNKVKTSWREWLSYPAIKGEYFGLDNDDAWMKNKINEDILKSNHQEKSADRLHMRFWFSLFPHTSGMDKNGYLHNWWKYFYTLDYVTSIDYSNSIKSNVNVGLNNKIKLDYILNYNSGKIDIVEYVKEDNNIDVSDRNVINFKDGYLYAVGLGSSNLVIYHDGKKIEYQINVSSNDEVKDMCEPYIVYSTKEPTKESVKAKIEFKNKDCTSLDNSYVFIKNGTHTFNYFDQDGNSKSLLSKVTWIIEEKNSNASNNIIIPIVCVVVFIVLGFIFYKFRIKGMR